MKNDKEKYTIDGIIDPDNHKDIVIGVDLASTGDCSIVPTAEQVGNSLRKLSKLMEERQCDELEFDDEEDDFFIGDDELNPKYNDDNVLPEDILEAMIKCDPDLE